MLKRMKEESQLLLLSYEYSKITKQWIQMKAMLYLQLARILTSTRPLLSKELSNIHTKGEKFV